MLALCLFFAVESHKTHMVVSLKVKSGVFVHTPLNTAINFNHIQGDSHRQHWKEKQADVWAHWLTGPIWLPFPSTLCLCLFFACHYLCAMINLCLRLRIFFWKIHCELSQPKRNGWKWKGWKNRIWQLTTFGRRQRRTLKICFKLC